MSRANSAIRRIAGPTAKPRSGFHPLAAARIHHPAPGFRDAGYYGLLGALMSVGRNGYSWSSAVSGAGGVFLLFYTQYLDPSNASHRGHGHQLRCLSE